jgi:glycosyltransferase involved in cell wall biosynthesis
MRIDQLIPAFHQGDAIGDTAQNMKRFFLSRGYRSDIYCLSRDESLEGGSLFFENFPPPSSEDIILYHFALPSPLTQAFTRLQGRKVLLYHNITPSLFFEGFSKEMTRITAIGRDELRTLASHVDLALADSEFNREELDEMGFVRSGVLPLFIDFGKYKKAEDRFTYEFFKDGRINILFAGRIVPNKKIEDLIKVVFYYKKYITPLVRLIIVGKTTSLPKYYQSLVRLADEFFLKSEEICFTGFIPDEEMFALYKASDAFLSLSEHEGFGLPLIESLVFDLPVFAYDCTAVPSTLDGAGVLIKKKKVEYVAELIHRVVHDSELRTRIIEGQRQRLRRFQEADQNECLMNSLTGFLS